VQSTTVDGVGTQVFLTIYGIVYGHLHAPVESRNYPIPGHSVPVVGAATHLPLTIFGIVAGQIHFVPLASLYDPPVHSVRGGYGLATQILDTISIPFGH